MKATVIFSLGAMAMFGFMRTRYAYPDISRLWYLADAAFAVAFLTVSILLDATP